MTTRRKTTMAPATRRRAGPRPMARCWRILSGIVLVASPGLRTQAPRGVDAAIESRSQVAQYGITWTFDAPHTTGRFCNGDWWIVGPVRIVGISPRSESAARVMHGSMLDPSPRTGALQGYDSRLIYHAYDGSLNVGLDVSSARPLVLAPGCSLVSTISREKPGVRPGLQTAAVLTVLPVAAKTGDFRPPYTGSDKTIRFHVSQLDFSKLVRLAPVGKPPAIESVARRFERPWIDHSPGANAQGLHPLDNLSEYGREIAADVGAAALVLNLDLPDEKKSTLLIRFVQTGIDLWGLATNGGERIWLGAGGHASGRKFPILLAGIVLGDEAMRGVGSRKDIFFGEDAQTFFVDEATVQYPSYYKPLVNGVHCGGYTTAMIGTPEWGIQHADQPMFDSADWGANYRCCCTANAWYGQLLATMVMGAKGLWNHDAVFAYQDRYLAECRKRELASHLIAWDPWALAMWERYRKDH